MLHILLRWLASAAALFVTVEAGLVGGARNALRIPKRAGQGWQVEPCN